MCEVEDVQIYWTWIGKTIKQNRSNAGLALRQRADLL